MAAAPAILPNRDLNADKPNQFVTYARIDPLHAAFARKRNALDSWHDNKASMKPPIIGKLYSDGVPRLPPFNTEDAFVDHVLTSPGLPESYFLRWKDRLAEGISVLLTPKMECLVNDAPFQPFAGVPNGGIAFPYDMGPSLFKYLKGSPNCLFFSDAIDTAPKKTKRSDHPYYFPIDKVIMEGRDVGFDERVIRQVVFADFKASARIPGEASHQVECKVLILADPGGSSAFRWYDLGNENTENRPDTLATAIAGAKPKRSNYPSGFFAGNDVGATVLETDNVPPVIALCTVAAKVLSDISVAIAASPQMQKRYPQPPPPPPPPPASPPSAAAGWLPLYDEDIDRPFIVPSKYIHNTGDRTSSLEASRYGADACYIGPMHSGVATGRFIPGEAIQGGDATISAYSERLATTRAEVAERFRLFIADLDNPDPEHFKVDGDPVITPSKVGQLVAYLALKTAEVTGLATQVDRFIGEQIAAATASIEAAAVMADKIRLAKDAYEILERRKLTLMPTSPTISLVLASGARKSLPASFLVCVLPDRPRNTISFKHDISGIVRSVRGGRRRTLRRMRGGVLTGPQQFALDLFNRFRDALFEASILRSLGGAEAEPQAATLYETFRLFTGFTVDLEIHAQLSLVKECLYRGDEKAYDEEIMQTLEDDWSDIEVKTRNNHTQNAERILNGLRDPSGGPVNRVVLNPGILGKFLAANRNPQEYIDTLSSVGDKKAAKLIVGNYTSGYGSDASVASLPVRRTLSGRPVFGGRRKTHRRRKLPKLL